jgi:hypothetical protein
MDIIEKEYNRLFESEYPEWVRNVLETQLPILFETPNYEIYKKNMKLFNKFFKSDYEKASGYLEIAVNAMKKPIAIIVKIANFVGQIKYT